MGYKQTFTYLAAGAALVASASAYAFDVDGFRTGMSVSDAAQVVRSQGWNLTPGNSVPGMYIEAHFGADGRISDVGPASLSFCNGILIGYVRSLDFDTEYAPKLRELIGEYGDTPRVEVRQDPWNGPGGGYIMSVSNQWDAGRERVYLSFEPEEHTGDGSLKHYRGASVSYVLPTACPKQ